MFPLKESVSSHPLAPGGEKKRDSGNEFIKNDDGTDKADTN